MSIPHNAVRPGSRQINQTFNTTTSGSSLANPTAGTSPLANAETDTTDFASELVLKQTKTTRSTSISPMRNHDNSMIHTGSSQATPLSTPDPTRVGKSTLEHVEFTDDLGVVYRIGFDPSGLINLTHLADVVGKDVESFLATDDVAVFWRHFGYPQRSSTSVIVTPVSRL